MSRFEKLREEISSIYKEVADREEASKRTEGEEKRKREAELEEQRLAEENWLSIKGPVLEMLQELNKEALNEEGQVSGWEKKKTGVHYHGHISWGDGGEPGWERTTYSCQSLLEVAELQIGDIGKVVVFRPMEYQKGNYKGENFTNENESAVKKNVYIGVFTPQKETVKKKGISIRVEEPKVGGQHEIPCPECIDVSSLSLIQPSSKLINEIEETFSAKLVCLYEVALLK